jgi:hypothetical protein
VSTITTSRAIRDVPFMTTSIAAPASACAGPRRLKPPLYECESDRFVTAAHVPEVTIAIHDFRHPPDIESTRTIRSCRMRLKSSGVDGRVVAPG